MPAKYKAKSETMHVLCKITLWK